MEHIILVSILTRVALNPFFSIGGLDTCAEARHMQTVSRCGIDRMRSGSECRTVRMNILSTRRQSAIHHLAYSTIQSIDIDRIECSVGWRADTNQKTKTELASELSTETAAKVPMAPAMASGESKN